MEAKPQIKLTLKSAAPPLRKLANKFDDDESDDEGTFRVCPSLFVLAGFERRTFLLYTGWEKEKNPPANVPPPPAASSTNQTSKKRSAESPPPTTPSAKVCPNVVSFILNILEFVVCFEGFRYVAPEGGKRSQKVFGHPTGRAAETVESSGGSHREEAVKVAFVIFCFSFLFPLRNERVPPFSLKPFTFVSSFTFMCE